MTLRNGRTVRGPQMHGRNRTKTVFGTLSLCNRVGVPVTDNQDEITCHQCARLIRGEPLRPDKSAAARR